MAILFGTSYFQLGNTQADLFAYVTAVFFTVFYHETAAAAYRPIVYSAVAAVVELPFILFAAALFFNIYFWMVGLPAAAYVYGFLVYWTFMNANVFLGQFLSSAMPALEVVMQVIPLLLNLWLLS